MYYLRTKPPVYTQQFTLQENKKLDTSTSTSRQNLNKTNEEDKNNNEVQVCRRGDPTCASCSA